MDCRLRCEVVRDLLPSYIDGLTSEVTNEEIVSHMSLCKECEKLYNEMKTPIENPMNTPMQTKEMDYLKKVKQQANKKIIIGVTLIAVLFLFLIGIRMYIVGGDVDTVASYNARISQTIEGKDVLVVEGQLTNRSKVYKKYSITVEDDTATIRLKERHALPWEDNNYYYVGYEIPSEVKRIVMNKDVIWEDGIVITKEANEIYETKHAYVGEMPANGDTARALQIWKLGNYRTSLQTTEEPYGWTLEFIEPITNDTFFNERMTKSAYVILSLIENLGEISWEYTNGSEVITKTVTTKDATKALGRDVKEYSNSLLEFQRFLSQLYL